MAGDDPLALDRETMRQLGYRTVDLLVDWLEREGPPLRRATPAEMRARLEGPPPAQPEPFERILEGLDRDVLPYASRDGHPRFFGFVPFAGTWPGALGDLIASACNLYVGSWMESAGPSQVERPEQVRVLPSDEGYRLSPGTLRAAMEADAARGLTPFCVVAQGGATNTGAVDPLAELASTCRAHGVWLHVDAAYGGFAVLADRNLLPGLDQADSVALDPHKWLYQPFECGCLLVRDGSALRKAFEILPDYLRDARARVEEVNFSDLGLQLTRSARALKLWVSLRYFGIDAFRTAIRSSLETAARAARRVEESETLELAAPPRLGVVCFRRRDLDEDGNAGLPPRWSGAESALSPRRASRAASH